MPNRLLLPASFALLAAACSVGPAWTADERQQLAAMQNAVRALMALPPSTLTTNAVATLPVGKDLDDVDVFLNVFPSLSLATGPGVKRAWGADHDVVLPTLTIFGATDARVATAGLEMRGFDVLHAFNVVPERGVVLLVTRRGEQTVALGEQVWSGSLWHRSYCPELSTDGSHFTFVQDNWLRDRAMLAPTEAPERAVDLNLPGVVQWPVWPGRDGSHVRAIVAVDGHIEVRDGDRIVATAESFAHPWFNAVTDRLQVHLRSGGKEQLLLGDRLLPPLDSYRWLRESADGKHHAAVGREGQLDHFVVDDQVVLRHPKILWIELSANGTWACAVQEDEQFFVVRANGRSEPLPYITELVLAPDGSSLAVCTRVLRTSSWAMDGVPLLGYDTVADLQLLPQKKGAVFAGHDASGWWLVTPNGRDGPFERMLHCRVLPDGKHAVCLAQRGREVHRRALKLP